MIQIKTMNESKETKSARLALEKFEVVSTKLNTHNEYGSSEDADYLTKYQKLKAEYDKAKAAVMKKMEKNNA